MARAGFTDLPKNLPKNLPNDLPKQNPCAQCGQPIAFPEWVEERRGRTAYLWHCYACDYRFEAVAIFDIAAYEDEALAA